MGSRKLEVKKHYIFDVDGTLTPSRQVIDSDFAVFFSNFCAENDVYLVTGSDKEKTIEQIGEEIYSLTKRVYNCSGSDIWEGETHIRSDEWKISLFERSWLEDKLEESSFPLRTGLHIEERPGMINFSIVGRNATLGERKLYVKYDKEHNERNIIAELFNNQFDHLIARPGGETGIDISPKGKDKSQILVDFDPRDEIHFFGDRMDPAGNDYPLKKEIIDKDLGMCYNIKDYNETWKLLKNL
jgi:phosphomannomutase|tara:strand:- start:248 stop:973 length:726 start_codon:yes stop_codon:yes gene_type:complete